MRWKQKKTPLRNNLRERSDFLLLPQTLNGITRWLEWATVLERKQLDKSGYHYDEWYPQYWVDLDPQRPPCSVCQFCRDGDVCMCCDRPNSKYNKEMDCHVYIKWLKRIKERGM